MGESSNVLYPPFPQHRPRRPARPIRVCPECRRTPIERKGWCDNCTAALDFRLYEYRRAQERKAAAEGLCPGCMKPAPPTRILGIDEGYVSWHVECAAARDNRKAVQS